MASFGEILAGFKSRAANEPENLAPLIDDQMLVNGMIAWKSVSIRFREQKDCCLKSDSEQWEWLWQNVDYDTNTFGIVAGVRQQDVIPLFVRLKGLRLIYPDGTINSLACQYLQGLILGKLRPATRGRDKLITPKGEAQKKPDADSA